MIPIAAHLRRAAENLDPFYAIATTDAADPEDRLDTRLGVAVAVRDDWPGVLPSVLARDLAQAARALPWRRRAALAYRQLRATPGIARATRN